MKRKLRLNQRKCLFYLFAFLFNLCLYKYALPVHLDLLHQAALYTCPACYGLNLCEQVKSGDIELIGSHRWTLSKVWNERNVFLARWHSRNQTVVLKNLATDQELAQLDQAVCSFAQSHRANPAAGCVPGQAAADMARTLAQPKSDLQGLSIGQLTSVTLSRRQLSTLAQFARVDLLRCAADQRLIDLLTHRSLHHFSRPSLTNLATILLANPEPLVSIVFGESGYDNNEADSNTLTAATSAGTSGAWQLPLPVYHGACGRLAVFSYVGRSVDSYYGSSWYLRAHFALQLLELAKKLSGLKNGLALYPTDWSANNFAVDKSFRVYLVDLENIIIVNQTRIKQNKAPGWDTYHSADRFGCKHCFSFSAEDLCSHAHTDHNYHGVCGGLLSSDPYSPGLPGGLLHSVPRDLLARHPLLPGLLDQCWQSTKSGGREEAAQLIMEILRSELEDVDVAGLQ